ncbi:MAG: galactose mutarotase [Ancalomicrobiaceae bacterium]|nr:galactose mutarotase [Ancalomicrobiaceae bacterium]
MTVTSFGHLADGTEVPLITISGGGLKVGVIGLGAVIRSLDFDAGKGPAPRVLGLETLADYVAHSPSMGIVAGRYGNRIGGSRFPLDGREVALLPNERGNHLHGGPKGFGKCVWSLADAGSERVVLTLVSADGDQGYPGRLEATCSYRITGDGVLSIELTATTDAPTVVNFATHSYFNLDGSPDILDHVLQIPAEEYTPVNAELIPTGELLPVAGTPFDFREARPIRFMVDGKRAGYDHNFVVARTKAATPRLMCRVTDGAGAVALEVHSTEPGVQFYDGANLAVPVKGLGGRAIAANGGLCLEPQIFPDTPNKPQFGSAVLRPGETYRQLTEYRFRAL